MTGDRDLTAGLHRGDPDALADLHRAYGGTVLAYLRSALRDPAAAEDVHQDVFLEVWRRGPAYDPDRGSIGTWVMLIARSRAIDHLRKRVPEPRDPFGPSVAAVSEREDHSAAPDLLIERWRMALLLARLPEEQAMILRMRFHEELTQTEIAERTGIALGTVKTYMVRALARLRDLIDEEDGG
jgi:RNA polymerase sigma-70 factor (ECF subfamily)